MELAEKIQKLRKERGLTQEQFAQQLFVSRTAVSKWETGRGTPSMESLRMIAQLCGITLDELVCARDVLTVAENENRGNLFRFAFCMDGICNMAAVMGLLLPLYKVTLDGIYYSVPLYRFAGWLAVFYWLLPVVMAVCGIVQLLLCRSECSKLKQSLSAAGTVTNICAILLLILSGQPYPAVLFFVLLVIKGAVLLIKEK